MKLSIITINFNNRTGLKKTIDSAVCQTFRDFEWIVIDGGSTDGSKELIEQYAEYFSFWISEPDKGIYNAMNKGILAAHGEYLQFLNSGDRLYDKDCLSRFFANTLESDIVYGDFIIVNQEGEEQVRSYPQPLSLRFFYQTTLCHNVTFIKRDILLNKLYDECYKIVSDWIFFLDCAINNCSFQHINEIIIYYDASGISSTNEDLVKKERSTVIQKSLPSMLIRDFEEMEKMEEQLNKEPIKSVLKYCGNKLYHKILTASLILIKLLDRLKKDKHNG